ncbi:MULTISPECIES: DUF445 domain-containing protein [Chitinophagaceae]
MLTPKELQLRKHKAFATGLFLLMVVVYIGTIYIGRHSVAGWIGYVHAFSEAAMVGALADWFAVTALFRYPLGLRIPHTNIIENKKKDIGENLGSFVKENFLTTANIRPYIEKMDVAKWISKWLREKKNQDLLLKEMVAFIKKILTDLDDREVVGFLSRKVTDAIQHIDFSKMVANGLSYVVDKQEHVKLLDSLLPEIKQYVENSQDMIRERVNKQKPLIGFLAGKKISRGFTQGIVDFIDEVMHDKEHWVREKLTNELEKLQYRIEHDIAWQEKINRWKYNIVASEKLEPYIGDAWTSIKTNFLDGMENRDSALIQYMKRNVEKFSNDLEANSNLQSRLNKWTQKYTYNAVLHNRDQVEKIIGDTVSHWKGRELSEKLELEVGKDLQFIRVNGTLVGGLVGLLIYSLTLLLFR